MNTTARRPASRAAQRGAIEQSNALTEAFPLIAAGVLVLVGVVLFVTVLWPESGPTERPSPAASVSKPAAGKSVAPPEVPTPSQAAPQERTEQQKSAPPPSEEKAPATAAATRASNAAPPTPVATPNAPSAVDKMVDAAIAGDDAQVKSAMKALAAERTPHGDRVRARDLNAKALGQMRKARYAEAIPLFDAAHRADPGDAEVRENLGYALLKAGRLDEARSALLSALEIGPQRASAWGSLGFVYAKQGRPAEAVNLILTAYRFAPDRRKAAEVYRKQAQTDPDPTVRAMLTEAVSRLNNVH